MLCIHDRVGIRFMCSLSMASVPSIRGRATIIQRAVPLAPTLVFGVSLAFVFAVLLVAPYLINAIRRVPTISSIRTHGRIRSRGRTRVDYTIIIPVMVRCSIKSSAYHTVWPWSVYS